jgi:hypothetical protein
VKSGRRTQNDDSMLAFDDMKAFGDDKWGSQAMETMQKIVESGAILAQREHALRAGEEGLRSVLYYMYVCMFVCIYIHIYIYIYIYLCIYIYICIYLYINIHIYRYKYTYKYIYIELKKLL